VARIPSFVFNNFVLHIPFPITVVHVLDHATTWPDERRNERVAKEL